MGGRKVGLQGDRGPVRLDGTVGVSGRNPGQPQIDMRRRVVRLVLDRALEGGGNAADG